MGPGHLYMYLLGTGDQWWKIQDHEATPVSRLETCTRKSIADEFRLISRLSQVILLDCIWMVDHMLYVAAIYGIFEADLIAHLRSRITPVRALWIVHGGLPRSYEVQNGGGRSGYTPCAWSDRYDGRDIVCVRRCG
jgi:hypothetical protein